MCWCVGVFGVGGGLVCWYMCVCDAHENGVI